MVFLALALAACGGKPAEPLRIATNIWPGYEPLYLARDLGEFEGSPVGLIEMPSSSEVIRAFRNGAVEAAALTLDEVLLLQQDGIDVRILWVMDVSEGADVVMARPGIRSLKDLAGKKVGVEGSALGAYMLSRALDAAGLQPRDLEIVPLTLDQHEQAYRDGAVDAVVTFEPVRTKLMSAGARVIFDSSRITDEIFDVLAARSDELKKRPQEFSRLKESWFKAITYLRSNPDDAAERMAKRSGISGAEYLESLKGLKIPDRQENDRLLAGEHPAILEPARRLAETMLQKKLLRTPVDPGRLLVAAEGG
jgi:NitT/TauT family transport system substrate-binding protein